MAVRGIQLLACALVMNIVTCLHSVESWQGLFSVNQRIFISDDDLMLAHRIYLEAANRAQKHLYLLKFRDTCQQHCHDKVKRKLTQQKYGKHHYGIVNRDHALIHTSPQTIESLLYDLREYITDSAPVLPQFKVSRQLTDRDSDRDSGNQNYCTEEMSLDLHVVLMPMDSTDVGALRRVVQAEGSASEGVFMQIVNAKSCLQSSHSEHLCVIRTSCVHMDQTVSAISALPFVQWVDMRSPMTLLSKWANGVAQSGNYQHKPIHDKNITGAGLVIGIADSGIDPYSCFFRDDKMSFPYNYIDHAHRKVVYYNTYIDNSDASSHGTTVSSVAAGKCSATDGEAQYNGAAFNSKIAFFDIGTPDDSVITPDDLNTELFQPLYNAGAYVQSMSWGAPMANVYDNDARSVDKFMNEHPDAIVFVAAGNDGENGARTVSTPATNKCGVAVGASLNARRSFEKLLGESKPVWSENTLAGFSSRGPVSDGRLKPELCAPGYYVAGSRTIYPHSQGPHCDVRSARGTSFAAPLMGGHAVLVREYFLRGFYPSGTATLSDAFSPSGALLKAMLVASSEALTRIIYDNGTVRGTSLADNNQGYGRIELDNSLTFLNATRDGLTLFVKGAADSSSEHYVEMSWLDAPHVYTFRTVADPNLGPLRVVLAYTDVYLASGASTPLANDLDIELTNATHTFYPLVTNQDGKYDRLNPLEMIILENPEPNSTYTVTVTAYSMTTAQSYALVITGEVGGDSNSRSNGDVSSEYWTSSGNVIYISVAALVIVCSCFSCCFCGRKPHQHDLKNGAPRQQHQERHHQLYVQQQQQLQPQQRHGQHYQRPPGVATHQNSVELDMGSLYNTDMARPLHTAVDRLVSGDAGNESQLQVVNESGLDEDNYISRTMVVKGQTYCSGRTQG